MAGSVNITAIGEWFQARNDEVWVVIGTVNKEATPNCPYDWACQRAMDGFVASFKSSGSFLSEDGKHHYDLMRPYVPPPPKRKVVFALVRWPGGTVTATSTYESKQELREWHARTYPCAEILEVFEREV
jgi:hypothetical protein